MILDISAQRYELRSDVQVRAKEERLLFSTSKSQSDNRRRRTNKPISTSDRSLPAGSYPPTPFFSQKATTIIS